MDALLRHNHDRIHALCRRLTGNPTDALDATQEALIAIVRGLDRFDGRSSFHTWSYRVATNACFDELRRRKRRRAESLDEREPPQLDGGSSSPETVVDRLDVDAALSAVPHDFRAAVVLRDLCGLDYAEIAEILQVPPGTVRSRIARGRAAVARELAGNLEVPPERLNPSS